MRHRTAAAPTAGHMSGWIYPADNAHEAAPYSSVVLRRLCSRICPHAAQLRQFNFELVRSQQPTDRVDLVEHSAQLSFRAWRCEGRTGQVHVASGAGASNREERAPWEPSQHRSSRLHQSSTTAVMDHGPRCMMPSTVPRREAQTSAGPRRHPPGRAAGDRSKRGDDWSLIHRYLALSQRHAGDSPSKRSPRPATLLAALAHSR